MHVIIFDMSSLRYQWDSTHTTVTLLSASGEVLASVDCAPGTSNQEAAFAAMDAALASARLRRSDSSATRALRRVAFYNPYTAQVALGSVPRTESYTDNEPLEVPIEGLSAQVQDGLLWCSTRVLAPLDADYSAVVNAMAAHRG